MRGFYVWYIDLPRCFCCWNNHGDLVNVVFFSKHHLRIYYDFINRKKTFLLSVICANLYTRPV